MNPVTTGKTSHALIEYARTNNAASRTSSKPGTTFLVREPCAVVPISRGRDCTVHAVDPYFVRAAAENTLDCHLNFAVSSKGLVSTCWYQQGYHLLIDRYVTSHFAGASVQCNQEPTTNWALTKSPLSTFSPGMITLSPQNCIPQTGKPAPPRPFKNVGTVPGVDPADQRNPPPPPPPPHGAVTERAMPDASIATASSNL